MKEILERIARLEPRRVALLAAQLQQRVDALDAARREPIAIVGMSCRFPGGADSPEAFWKLLREGGDAVREVPADRWDIDALYDPDPDAPGRMSTRWGAFLDDVAHFDAAFFGIAPREAVSMDPQQRLLLELVWEALERAGIPADRLNGSATGVFVGISGTDYAQLLLRDDPRTIDAYTASGAAHSVAAGRVSFLLGLQGPCFPIDTACSSSLVSVHQAVQSLRSGECTMALAGGVNLILSPDTSIGLSKARMMAPDGRCKAFDARADGFVRGEGGAVLVLKRLSDAVADGDPVVALIRGSAINQDGRSNGLTAPNGPAQEAVIRAALANAGVEPASIGYVEAHGTGTSLGDPIEVQAIAAALGAGRAEPLPIGSVKANVGHLESAAGVAGLVKLVLALQHRAIPAQIHVQSLNPHIPWDMLPVAVPLSLREWRAQSPLIGGISSFGFSGTNAHVIIEEAPHAVLPARAVDERPCVHVLTLSARSDAALRALAARYAEHLAADDADLADICFTANTGRARHEHRLAIISADAASCSDALRAAGAGRTAPRVHRGTAPLRRGNVAFLFSGQGAQRLNMGRGLYESQPVFRAALDHCDAVLRPHLAVPLLEVMYPPRGAEADAQALLDSTAYAQPALFALEHALVALWRAWGVGPDAVAGHSIGEYAAACAAGALELDDALRLVAERGRLMQALPHAGAMAAVFADADAVADEIAPFAETVAIAGINEPGQTVISGAAAHIDSLLESFSRRGVRCRPLNVSHAFHSPLMDEVLEPFTRHAASIRGATPHTSFISTVTGGAMPGDALAGTEYWVRQIRQPVRFAAAARALHDAGCRTFIAIGPDAALLALAQRSIDDDAAAWLPSVRAEQTDMQQMLDSVARLFVAGVDVDWRGLHQDTAPRRVLVPTYPFQRERFWHPAADAARMRAQPPQTVRDDVADLLYDVVWQPSPAPAAETLSTPVHVGAALAHHVCTLSEAHGMAAYDAMLPRLDRIAAGTFAYTLARLGWEFTPGGVVQQSDLMRVCGIADRHVRLVHRMLVVLAEDGFLSPGRDGWLVRRMPPVADPSAAWEALHAEFPQFTTELALIARCAAALADVLRGTMDPLQLLFPQDGGGDAERLYSDAPVAQMFNTLVAEAVAEAARGCAPGSRLRVLEIGGGTGGTTASVLGALPADTAEYVFTDISPHFVQRARQRFAGTGFVRCAPLDITRDPAAQDFEPHGFDIIVAANVLHATPDLGRSLAHVQALLAPGGVLVLYEAVRAQRFSDLTVGLTAGWWSFTDPALRPDYALLSRDGWRTLLAQAGFDGCAIVPGEGAGAVSHQAVIVTRASAAPQRTGAVLIVGDPCGVGRALAGSLQAVGMHAVLVDGEDAAPARHIQSDGAAMPWRDVVYLRALDATLTTDDPDASALQEPMLAGALALVQSLVRTASGASPPRLWLVTRGAQPAGRAVAEPAQAPLWGLGQTVALEHPDLRCTCIDLDPAADAQAHARLLAAELARSAHPEDRIALHSGERLVPRLVRHATVAGAAPVRFAPDATCVVTGGMRGIGLRLAEWLVERGARSILLVGRSAPGPDSVAIIDRLERAGAHVTVARGDVADRTRLAQILDHAGATLPPVRGIFHCAGVLDDGVLLQQDWHRFATVLAPKVTGAWNLHALTRGLDLDCFVLFSSGVALLGAAGQANHAAANTFLGALAHHRRALGLPALTIDWGAWSELGAAVEHRVDVRGTAMFTPAQALAALDYALGRAARYDRSAATADASLTQIAVLAADWHAARARFGAGRVPPFLRVLLDAPAAASATPASAVAVPPLRQRLRDAPPNRRSALLLAHVRDAAAQVLGAGEPQRVGVHQPLQEQGLDSLMAVELRNCLARDVSHALPATLLYEHATVSALADYLGREVLHSDIADAAPHSVAAGDETAGADDIAALLLQKLEQLDALRR